MEYVLTTSNLSKSYGQHEVLHDLSMHIPKGSIYGFVGKNGAGKTTFIRLICGLQKPTNGGYNLTDDIAKYIRQLRNRSLTIKQLTEELFHYSVISSTDNISFEKLNICRVLEETLLSFEGALMQANIEPNIQMPDTPVWRNLDSSALSRIFSNILNNIIKYSDGDFDVVLKPSGTIIFSNSAKELSTVAIGKLFDRFYTVNSARKSTGLGLSIAKLLVERMGGTIYAEYKNEKLIITLAFSECSHSL